MAISNGWRLHVLISKTKQEITYMDQLSFRRIIARTYLRPTKTKSRPSSSAALGGRNNNGHNPERMENPLRCVMSPKNSLALRNMFENAMC